MFVRTLSTLSVGTTILVVGAVLPWNDLVLGSLILLSLVGLAVTIVLALIRHGRKYVRAIRHFHATAVRLDADAA